MLKHNLTFMVLSVALVLGMISGCASPAPARRVSPVSAPTRPASRPGISRTGNRYALVIGNGEYKNIEKLENAVNDAEDIAEALMELGFDVDLMLNATEAQFSAAIDDYIAKLAADSANEGFFWYAGHGVQLRDQNFLLPVDASIESERALQRSAFSLDELLLDLEEAGNKVNVVILDACRNNPLPSSSRGSGTRGLAAIQDVPGDLFVMFSTAAGDVAADGEGKRNSPFAEAFLKYIASPDPVPQMAAKVTNETLQLTGNQQRPFSRGSIISDGYYSINPDRSGGGGTNSNEGQALVFYNEGVSLYSSGEPDRAILYFTEAVRLSMETPDVYKYRGNAYADRKDYDLAIADYTEAIRLDPNYAVAYNNRGKAYWDKGEYDRAIADCTEAIRLDPKYVWAYNNRGNAYADKGEYDRGIADYTEAMRLDPNYVWAYNNRGVTYNDKGDYDRGITDLTEAIRLDPKFVLAYANRGDAYRLKGEYNRAIADCTEAIRLDPNYARAYGVRGHVYSNREDYDRAIVDYTEAIRLDPKYVWAYSNRGIAYAYKGEYDRGIADCTEAIRLDPKFVWAYANRSYAYIKKGEYDRAIADCTEAIRLDPKDAMAYNNRGVGYENKGNYNRAIADFTEAIRINPNFELAKNNLEIARRRGR